MKIPRLFAHDVTSLVKVEDNKRSRTILLDASKILKQFKIKPTNKNSVKILQLIYDYFEIYGYNADNYRLTKNEEKYDKDKTNRVYSSGSETIVTINAIFAKRKEKDIIIRMINLLPGRRYDELLCMYAQLAKLFKMTGFHHILLRSIAGLVYNRSVDDIKLISKEELSNKKWIN